MPVVQTSIAGLYVVKWEEIFDARGFFRQTYQFGELSTALGRDLRLRQGNHSRSHPRVLRGFHREPCDKLIYVVRGHATCVVADTRPESATFGTALSFEMGDSPGRRIRLFVREGLANAFYCHTEVDYLNDVSEEFDPSNRSGVAWNDPTLDIPWPDRDPILSDSDRQLMTLQQLYPDHSRFFAHRG